MTEGPGLCPIPCNLCDSEEIEEISLTDRRGRRLRTTICRRCGLVWSNPRPGEDQVRQYYASEYRRDYKGAVAPGRVQTYRAACGAARRVAALRPLLVSKGVILDAGCGAGELVYMLRRLGYDARGVEPDRRYAQYARTELGLPVETAFVQDVRVAEESLDAILMFHALEHVENPLDILTRFWRWLKPGGMLVVEVPNVEAVCQAPGQRFHFAHFYNFNRFTLEAAGERAGFVAATTSLSPDEGNVTTVFLRANAQHRSFDGIAGNYQRIVTTIRRHTTLRHYVSAAPYVRPVQRAVARIEARAGIVGLTSGRAVLDAVFATNFP